MFDLVYDGFLPLGLFEPTCIYLLYKFLKYCNNIKQYISGISPSCLSKQQFLILMDLIPFIISLPLYFSVTGITLTFSTLPPSLILLGDSLSHPSLFSSFLCSLALNQTCYQQTLSAIDHTPTKQQRPL